MPPTNFDKLDRKQLLDYIRNNNLKTKLAGYSKWDNMKIREQLALNQMGLVQPQPRTNKYFQAVKEWNKQNIGQYCTPKKDSTQYKEVIDIMNGVKPSPKKKTRLFEEEQREITSQKEVKKKLAEMKKRKK